MLGTHKSLHPFFSRTGHPVLGFLPFISEFSCGAKLEFPPVAWWVRDCLVLGQRGLCQLVLVLHLLSWCCTKLATFCMVSLFVELLLCHALSPRTLHLTRCLGWGEELQLLCL